MEREPIEPVKIEKCGTPVAWKWRSVERRRGGVWTRERSAMASMAGWRLGAISDSAMGIAMAYSESLIV